MYKLDFNKNNKLLLDVLESALILEEPIRTSRIKEILNGTYELGYKECQKDLRTVLGISHPVEGW